MYIVRNNIECYNIIEVTYMASEAQIKAQNKWLAKNYTEVRFKVKNEEAERIKARAAEKGMSLRAYMIELVERDMKE
jgi:predicted DNA binding CopG/RHH family protein